ncbi:Putative aminopeptidase YsdC [Rosistilla carotiformis]|uniref:Aminopeptidase YsdC n=1 Tax=Rosistilla carotiformis TaxID=2528017 RepID=A0A518JXI4_9BACT|nr:Putative aminopeptidase YsdC [Rosistilla carotiformis]
MIEKDVPLSRLDQLNPAADAFLKTAIETPSPSGYEERIQALVREYIQPAADEVRTDVHGNVMAIVNPAADTRLMFAGHCDQIGMLVTYIDELGFLYAQTIGGWDPQQLIGQRMIVWTKTGPIPGSIARKPIHLLNDAERKKVVNLNELWIDIGAKDQQAASELVRIGDPVTLKLELTQLQEDLISGPGMDNKTGMWVVIEALRRAAGMAPTCGIYSVSTVQEEIGLRGATTAAASIKPHVGIAVDVTHATDCPTIDKTQQGDIKLGSGPVIFRGPNMNPKVVQRLVQIADELRIPYQMAAAGRATPNDANALQISSGGVATGLVAIPNRYMHSAVETVSMNDLDSAAELLANFAARLTAEDDFTPSV